MPFVAMRESVREVLPWSTCARMQMLRMLEGLVERVMRREGGMVGIFVGGDGLNPGGARRYGLRVNGCMDIGCKDMCIVKERCSHTSVVVIE